METAYRSGWSAPYLPPNKTSYVPSTLEQGKIGSSGNTNLDRKNNVWKEELLDLKGIDDKKKKIENLLALNIPSMKSVDEYDAKNPFENHKEIYFEESSFISPSSSTSTDGNPFGDSPSSVLTATSSSRRTAVLPSTEEYAFSTDDINFGVNIKPIAVNEATKEAWKNFFDFETVPSIPERFETTILSPRTAPIVVATSYGTTSSEFNVTSASIEKKPLGGFSTMSSLFDTVDVTTATLEDFDPFYVHTTRTTSAGNIHSIRRKKSDTLLSYSEKQLAKLELLLVSNEINECEANYLKSLLKDKNNKSLKVALRLIGKGDVGPLTELLRAFKATQEKSSDEEESDDSDHADTLSQSSTNSSSSSNNRSSSHLVDDDGIPSWIPANKKGEVPPTLLRLRGKDLCGDIMMRIRSKLITKKWKHTFFQIHGDAIATYSATEDWVYSRQPYWIRRLRANYGILDIERKQYNNLPLFVFKLIREDDGEVLAKFGSISKRNIEALHKELRKSIGNFYEKRFT